MWWEGHRVSCKMTTTPANSAPAMVPIDDQSRGVGPARDPEVPPATSIEALALARRRQAAARALAEARDRRAEAERGSKALKMGEGTGERDGRGGLDPVRYGDWEVKGIATDF
jgi:hypothetical protein